MRNQWFVRIIVIILFLLGCFYLTRPSAHAVWSRGRDDYYQEKVLTIEECVEKIEFHKGEAKRIFDEVKDRVWWLPSLDDRKKARHIFSLIVPLVSSAGISGKLAASAYVMFGTYGLDCLDEWDWIQKKWHWLEYHTDLAEFYERYLVHSARLMFVPESGI